MLQGLIVTADFPAAATSVGAARRFVGKVLDDWDLAEIADDAILATSELATNAVTYAGTAFEVSCRLEGDQVHIEVRDRHPARAIAMPGIGATSGRGLPSTARLADSWGVTYERTAKSVWFRLPSSRNGAGTTEAARAAEEAQTGDEVRTGDEARSRDAAGSGDTAGTDDVTASTASTASTAATGTSRATHTSRAADNAVAPAGGPAAAGGRGAPDEVERPVPPDVAAGRVGDGVPSDLRGWLAFIAEASDLLAGTLDQERTMALLAQLVVPRLAAWCAVYGVDDVGAARPRYIWHADENKADTLREQLAHVALGPPVEDPGPWYGLVPGGSSDEVYAFPLIARGRRIGMMVIGRPPGDRFDSGILDLAEELSRRAALAIDNARLYTAQTSMSRSLQRSLLPPELPDIPGLDVAVVYEPAGQRSEVGGDFYDVFESRPDPIGRPRWRFAIGDVCGTGPEAAAVTGLARYALRILAGEGLPVPDVLARLNRLILAEGPRARLLTLLHGEISVDERGEMHLEVVSAGHPPPLLLYPDGRVEGPIEPQPLLGVFEEDVDFRAKRLTMEPGQLLLCVTDGVTERREGNRMLGDGQGLERLLSSFTGMSAGAVAAGVQRAVREFGTNPSNDDVALIVLRAG
ncbi:MAG TPA: SpoIIE family protein phosphatase [Streptosporangiaceae bacterium]|nr:SpoIIE family protein phosphatase [Streptosporangiaceae bacterium]